MDNSSNQMVILLSLCDHPALKLIDLSRTPKLQTIELPANLLHLKLQASALKTMSYLPSHVEVIDISGTLVTKIPTLPDHILVGWEGRVGLSDHITIGWEGRVGHPDRIIVGWEGRVGSVLKRPMPRDIDKSCCDIIHCVWMGQADGQFHYPDVHRIKLCTYVVPHPANHPASFGPFLQRIEGPSWHVSLQQSFLLKCSGKRGWWGGPF